MEPTQNGPLCRRCFQTHFLLPACQILPGPFVGKMVGIGTVYCISYWATHCHYNVQHVQKRLWGKFREMYSSVTSEGLVPWLVLRQGQTLDSLHVVMSTCTPQPRAFTIKCRVNLAVVSHIGLRIGCSSVVIPNGIWILKKKEKKEW